MINSPFLRIAAPACAAALCAAGTLSAQQTAVPNLMSYQAFVTDASNVPLGNANPTNYVTTFRIYGSATGNDVVWAEQQTVTVFQGNFSVLLGNGQPVGGEPRPALDTVFAGAERYIGITVAANPEFTPRQRLLTNAYAYRAKMAEGVTNSLSVTGNTTFISAGLNVDSGTLQVDPVSNRITTGGSLTTNGNFGVNGETFLDNFRADGTATINGTLDANGALDVDGFTNLDGFASVGNSSVTGLLSATELSIDNGVLYANPSSNAASINGYISNVTLNVRGQAGHVHYLQIERPNGVDLFEVSDGEIRSYVPAAMGSSMSVAGSIDANGSLDVDGFTNLDGFSSQGNGRIDGRASVNMGAYSNVTFQSRRIPDDAWAMLIEDVDGTDLVSSRFFGTAHWFEVNTGNAAKPGGGSWAVVSDRRFKKNVRKLDGSLDKLLKLRPVSFEYSDSKGPGYVPGKQVGFVAQDVEKVFPEWVEEVARQRPGAEAPGDPYKILSIKGFESLTVQALSELRNEKDQQIAEQAAEIEKLGGENAVLKERLDRLEALVQAAAEKGN